MARGRTWITRAGTRRSSRSPLRRTLHDEVRPQRGPVDRAALDVLDRAVTHERPSAVAACARQGRAATGGAAVPPRMQRHGGFGVLISLLLVAPPTFAFGAALACLCFALAVRWESRLARRRGRGLFFRPSAASVASVVRARPPCARGLLGPLASPSAACAVVPALSFSEGPEIRRLYGHPKWDRIRLLIH